MQIFGGIKRRRKTEMLHFVNMFLSYLVVMPICDIPWAGSLTLFKKQNTILLVLANLC